MSTIRTIALLRGINVGSKTIKMADLRDLFASLGFAQAKTVLASGNIAWDTEETDTAALQATIEQGIAARFGFSVSVIVMPRAQIEQLIARDPFAGINITEDTRLYVTFLPYPTPTTLDLPYHTPDLAFTMLSVTDTEVCSVLTLSPQAGTVDAMKVLEQAFGKQITTRNWNTVLKLAAL